jgi:NTE family protein
MAARQDDNARRVFNEVSAAFVLAGGVPGFFAPRLPPAVFNTPGTPGAISVYDTTPLSETLCELIDFDLLNSGTVRLSIGAVEVKTGNMKYFDTSKQRIGPEHIKRRAAAGLSPSRDRRRALLGWRFGFQYPAAARVGA